MRSVKPISTLTFLEINGRLRGSLTEHAKLNPCRWFEEDTLVESLKLATVVRPLLLRLVAV